MYYPVHLPCTTLLYTLLLHQPWYTLLYTTLLYTRDGTTVTASVTRNGNPGPVTAPGPAVPDPLI